MPQSSGKVDVVHELLCAKIYYHQAEKDTPRCRIEVQAKLSRIAAGSMSKLPHSDVRLCLRGENMYDDAGSSVSANPALFRLFASVQQVGLSNASRDQPNTDHPAHLPRI